MLIKKAADIRESDVTPKELFLKRREFIAAAGVTAAAVATNGLGLFGDDGRGRGAESRTRRSWPTSRRARSAPTRS